MTETFSLTREELRRVEVMSRVDSGLLTASDAAKLLELSVRQVRRILAAYRKEGPAALAHGNRGRKPKHAISTATRERVVELTKTKYPDYNHQHLSEELVADGIVISRNSVRRILTAAGLVSPKQHRRPKHRSRRERYPQEGMLVQIDGSPHDWLEGRGPRLTLHAAIDDATGKLLGGCFRLAEDAAGYLALLRQVVLEHGVPLAVYHDRHEIFVHNPKAVGSSQSRETIEEQLAGIKEPTQVGRALVELGIRQVQANSPQAKGRVERLFQTLQDRLVKWLREQDVTTLAEANQVLASFLGEFNARFAVPPTDPALAYRRLPSGFRPEEVFCFKYRRTVAHDNTVRFFHQSLQLLADDRRVSFAKLKVEVHERLDGSVGVYHAGRLLGAKEAPGEPQTLRARRSARPSVAIATRPGSAAEASAEVPPVRSDQPAVEGNRAGTDRTIEKSNSDSATSSDALTGKRDQGRKATGSNGRPVGGGYVDKWTGERVVPAVSPPPSHPWRRPLNPRRSPSPPLNTYQPTKQE
jgi:transposase